MEIKRNSTSLFLSNAFRSDKSGMNRKSLKLDDEKNVFSKFYNSVRRDKKKSTVLDQDTLEQLDAMFKTKDGEEENARGGGKDVNPRVLKRRDSLISLPDIRPAPKETIFTKNGITGGNVNTAAYRNKRANSDKSDVARKMEMLTKLENLKQAHFDKERTQGQAVASCSRVPSTLLPPLHIKRPKRPRSGEPSSPILVTTTTTTIALRGSREHVTLQPKSPRPSTSSYFPKATSNVVV